MDISKWPLSEIMQLPDHCFGKRWLVITNRRVLPAAVDEWISDTPLPNRFVLWSITIWGVQALNVNYWFKIALGDQDPTTSAIFATFTPLFDGDLENDIQAGAIFNQYGSTLYLTMRRPIEAMGKRFAVQFNNVDATLSKCVAIAFEVSAIPDEVPDWIFGLPAAK